MDSLLIEKFFKTSKNTIYIQIDENLKILDSNTTFKKYFYLPDENLQPLNEILRLNNDKVLNFEFLQQQTDQFILQGINNSNLSCLCSCIFEHRKYIIIGDIKKEEDLEVIEKMSKITSQLASTTRELHKKNSLLVNANEEIKEKEQMIITQSRFVAMNELLVMLAHQWRQPLNAISLNNAILTIKVENNEFDPDTYKAKLEKTDKIIQDLSNTINLFATQLGKESKDSVSINDVIQEVCELIYPTIKSHGINVEKNLNSQAIISIVPTIMTQICFIVVQNVIDAFKNIQQEEKLFKVTTYDKNEHVVVEYSDNAGGIPEEILDKVFEPYFSTKKEKNDVGLGLYTAKLLCERMLKASMKIENKDNGVTITIKIPNTL